jgi:TonB family protein
MSAAVNDRPHEIVPLPHLPLTGELHPLRREFARWLATGNVITITIAVVVCATLYFWPRPAVPTDGVQIADPGVTFGPLPILTGKNDIGYKIPAKVDNGTFVAAPDDELMKEAQLGQTAPGGDGVGVPGEEVGPISGFNAVAESLVVAPPKSRDDYVWFSEAPTLISCDSPVYPTIVRDTGIEGTVMVRVFVALNGHVKDAYVVDGGPALREAALTCARTAFFKPAMQGTHPVEVWVVIPITFRLSECF